MTEIGGQEPALPRDDESVGPCLFSDNVAPVCDEVMAALLRANRDCQASDGADGISAECARRFDTFFECRTEVFPVVTGTAANALCLAALSPPYGGVLCHETSHINVDEAGAPEFFTHGAKLIPITGAKGKLSPENLEKYLRSHNGNIHQVELAAISISQPTECGTVYLPEEIVAISKLAKAHGLSLHMDGARLANALVSLKCSPAESSWRVGVDALSFGATKNGAMCAEAAVLFGDARSSPIAQLRKRAGHLLSKSRYVAAQLCAMFENDLWKINARNANEMASLLEQNLAQFEFLEIAYPVDTNMIFIRDKTGAIEKFLEGSKVEFGTASISDDHLIRLVTSFSTGRKVVERIYFIIQNIAGAL